MNLHVEVAIDAPRSDVWRQITDIGKTATETMWITDATEAESYETEASSHGSHYHSRIAIAEENGATRLRMDFDATPQTLGAKVMWALTGFMFKGATRKALQQDLEDIKVAVETRPK